MPSTAYRFTTTASLLFLVLLLPGSHGHGSLIVPIPRNAFDAFLPPFARGRGPSGISCNCGDSVSGCDTAGDRAPGASGQPCLWFSQGCFIGCNTCSGKDREPEGVPKLDNTNDCSAAKGRGGPSQRPAGASSMPTLPKRLWTMNRIALEDSPDDVYRFHPWRAPGSAPVTDACGTAGGTTPQFSGPGETVFFPVRASPVRPRNITLGDRGSLVLPPGPSAAMWQLGSVVEVAWGIRVNHGEWMDTVWPAVRGGEDMAYGLRVSRRRGSFGLHRCILFPCARCATPRSPYLSFPTTHNSARVNHLKWQHTE